MSADGFYDDGFVYESSGDVTVEDPEDLYKGGGKSVQKEGFYHAEVSEVEGIEGDESKLRQVKVNMTIHQGDHEDQIGKTIYHTIYLENWEDKSAGIKRRPSEAAEKGLFRFASQGAFSLRHRAPMQ